MTVRYGSVAAVMFNISPMSSISRMADAGLTDLSIAPKNRYPTDSYLTDRTILILFSRIILYRQMRPIIQ